jgi:signal transduction histidine kinase
MGGFQASTLNAPEWYRYDSGRPHELNVFIASAFARYPYPNSVFAWRAGESPDGLVFFYRTERRPTWLVGPSEERSFPVALVRDQPVASQFRQAIAEAASRSQQLSVHTLTLGDTPHQLVVQLFYGDDHGQEVTVAAGFTVDLDWVRRRYFADLVSEIRDIGHDSTSGLGLTVVDAQGRQVAGPAQTALGASAQRRFFSLKFVDADAGAWKPPGFADEEWQITVGHLADESLFQDAWEAAIVLALASAAALVLAAGLFLVVKAERASSRIATMRSDFVSAATHELKTPIATIRAAAETISLDRLSRLTAQQCGRIVIMEARRLGRLVENMLAYSRIVDAADTYAFAPLEVAAIFNDIQEDFEATLDRLGFVLDWEIGEGATAVRGDRAALRLLFGNLVDNSIKYSGKERYVRLTAHRQHGMVSIAVADHGIGIAADEVQSVTQRFVRGRNAPGGGTGLGLAIASRIARDHGGTLTIDTAVSKGTTVRVSLPLVSFAAASVEPVECGPSTSPTAPEGGRP